MSDKRTWAASMAQKTEDAYSCRRWGGEWVKCCEYLLKNYTTEEAEAFLRSKHMRWVADVSPHRYPKLSDLERYCAKLDMKKEVRELAAAYSVKERFYK